jgi:hypothetical protein
LIGSVAGKASLNYLAIKVFFFVSGPVADTPLCQLHHKVRRARTARGYLLSASSVFGENDGVPAKDMRTEKYFVYNAE